MTPGARHGAVPVPVMTPANINQARWPLLTALIALAALCGFGTVDAIYAGHTASMIVALIGLIAAACAWRAFELPSDLVSSNHPAHDTAAHPEKSS